MLDISRIRGVVDHFHESAEFLRHWGAVVQAHVLDAAASKLDAELNAWLLETLTLEEAAEESDLSYSAIQKKVARGDLPNAGRKGSPRVRRCDLLGAAPQIHLETKDGTPDVAGEILTRRGAY